MLKRVFSKHKKALILLFATWGLFFTYFFANIIKFKEGSLYFGHQNVWSDWSLHVGIANIFAFKQPGEWFMYHPIYAQGKFTYPFLADAISGLLQRTGLSLSLSFIIPSIIASFVLIYGLYFFFYLLTKSRKTSIMAISFLFFSSGLGFIDYFKDFLANPKLNSLLLYPPMKYTSFNSYDWYTGNVIVGLFAPQRGFLFGMCFGIWSLNLLIYSLGKNHKRLLILAGLLAGMLPIVHAHSFIAVTIIGGTICLMNLKKWREWLYFALPAGILSIFLFVIFIQGGIESKTFLQLLPGWTSDGTIVGWVKMWLSLWGTLLPISVLGLYLIYKSKWDNIRKSTLIGFIIIFIISNLLLFQPVRWDNTKLFWWSYLGFSTAAAYFITFVSRKNLKLKLVSSILILSLVLTGFLELLNFSQIENHSYMISSREEIQMGKMIREKTGNNEIFLTAPKHNHLVYMWGLRPILLGYTAWAWNFGFNYQKTERDLYTMYGGGDEAKKLLREYKISYVFIGPFELNEAYANEQYFENNFPVILQDNSSRIYDVRSLLIN